MHKFLFLVLIAYRLGAMENEELAPEFRVPSIVMRMARHGARQFGLDQLPLICKVDETTTWLDTFFTAMPAVMLSKCYVMVLLSRTDLIQEHSFEGQQAKIMHQIYGSSHKPQDTILLFPLFFKASYGTRKGTLLHELWHVMQLDTPIDSLTYPRGIEQEADMQAVHAMNCYICAKEYASTFIPWVLSFLGSGGYATRVEILDVASQMSKDQRCPYHALVMSHLSYRAVHQIMCHQDVILLASGACAGCLAAKTVHSSSLVKTACVTSVLMPALATYLIVSGDSLKNWLGREVEAQVARGELEP